MDKQTASQVVNACREYEMVKHSNKEVPTRNLHEHNLKR